MVSKFCPFTALSTFIEERKTFKNDSEPLFIFRDRSLVKPNQLHQVLKKTLKISGYDKKFYSFHGIQGGCAGDFYKKGISVETIRKLGRWKSNAIYTYLRNMY